MKNKTPSTPKSIAHITLNTGHHYDSPRFVVSEEIIDLLGDLVTQKAVPPLIIPWDLTIRIDTARQIAVFALLKKQHRIVTCVVAFGSADDQAWQMALESFRSDPESRRLFGDKRPPKPSSTPWLSVQLHVGMTKLPHEEISMLADFERCLAWAIIKQYRHA